VISEADALFLVKQLSLDVVSLVAHMLDKLWTWEEGIAA
jgi:hypothetical protein